jgi:hypothetical protein
MNKIITNITLKFLEKTAEFLSRVHEQSTVKIGIKKAHHKMCCIFYRYFQVIEANFISTKNH